MIQLTARIFKDGQVVGYQATDGTQTRNLTKKEAWAYAKQKQILNVVASGTLQNPSLSGTNGFHLKELPELKTEGHVINKSPTGMKYEKCDLYASIIRIFTENPMTTFVDKALLMDIGKQALKSEINSNKLDENKLRTLQNNLEATALLRYNRGSGVFNSSIVGLVVKNIGDTPISFNRVLSETLVITNEIITINPGQEIPMSRTEFAILVSRQEFNGAISNAQLCTALYKKEVSNIRHIVRSFYAVSRDKCLAGLHGQVNEVNFLDYASEEDYVKYYKIYAPKEITTSSTKQSVTDQTVHKNVSTSPIDLFKKSI